MSKVLLVMKVGTVRKGGHGHGVVGAVWELELCFSSNMAEQSIQPFCVLGAESRKYKPHVILDGIYTLLVKKGVPLHL
jgi:hypothetical protein